LIRAKTLSTGMNKSTLHSNQLKSSSGCQNQAKP
jgi:hypothetical protein